VEVTGLDCGVARFSLSLADGRSVKTQAVVVAVGARYRRPAIPRLQEFEGRGIWYWASPIETRMCRQEEIALVGGGNSAGQAAVFLSSFAAKISMLVRAESLAASMSRYLIERIEARPNIELLCRTEIVALTGAPEGRLERVRWRHAQTGAETERPIRNVFLFIGADPATNWLRACGVGLDGKGFVSTGSQAKSPNAGGNGRRPLPLESNVPGVFAVGDARSGSVKRVGGAIGEGAAVVAQLHSYLAAHRPGQAAESST
jgi:thioredoxin reductase (NADPH)